MTREELREAVARAMPELLGPTHRLILAVAALAVVREALREPTPEMVGSAQERKSALDGATLYHGIWRAMLAASALGGPEHG